MTRSMPHMTSDDVGKCIRRIVDRLVHPIRETLLEVLTQPGEKPIHGCTPELFLVPHVVPELRLEHTRVLGDPPCRCTFETVRRELSCGRLEDGLEDLDGCLVSLSGLSLSHHGLPA